MLREWEKLPKFMPTEEVRPYYDSLKKKKIRRCYLLWQNVKFVKRQLFMEIN